MMNALDNEGRVAVIGMAGRFPGARNLEEFWENIAAGRDTITRAEEFTSVDPAERAHVAAGGVLEGADEFDAGFFGFSPREAEVLDPQQRIFLQTAWHSLEDAGWRDDDDECHVGVFASTGLSTYLLHNVLKSQTTLDAVGHYQAMLSNDKDFLATRVAYKLGLTGPAITVQTACSSSLAAIHLACQSLLAGECDIALAGGVTVSSPLGGGYLYEPGGILSPDGTCRPFDAAANGTVPGNGVGVVVLRRHEDAAQDRVRAVVRGSAMNNDGDLKVGYTAPSVDGQAKVIAEALAMADMDATAVSYVETHGTATPMGDPIEVTGLDLALGGRSTGSSCVLGSVKSNIGHLDAASGVAAFIKTVLMLEHRTLAPTCHFRQAHPELQLDKRGFEVLSERRDWNSDGARVAGVSSFGIGGTNVHVILAEAEQRDGVGVSEAPFALSVSAKTRQGAVALAHEMATTVEDPSRQLDAIVATLGRRRQRLGFTAAAAGSDRANLAARLRALTPQDVVRETAEVQVCFLFPGQGSQFAHMGRDLYGQESVYREAFDTCAEFFHQHADLDLQELLYVKGSPDEMPSETSIVQAALFAVEYATCQLWRSWGVLPDVVLGHSIGELAAACAAGVWSLADATRIVATRGKLMGAQEPGAMLSLQTTKEKALDIAPGDCSVAAVNAPESVVVAGPMDLVEILEQRAGESGISTRRLRTSHAFHSRSMEPAARALADTVATVTAHAPKITLISNLTAQPMTAAEASSASYWAEHVRGTVRFADSVSQVLSTGPTVFLEIGPGEALSRLVPRAGQEERCVATLSSMPDPRGSRPVAAADRARLVLGNLGVLDFSGEQDVVPVSLPGYPFARDRYWIEPDPEETRVDGRGLATTDAVIWEDRWSQISPWLAEESLAASPVLALVRGPRGEAVCAALTEHQLPAVRVLPPDFDDQEPTAWATAMDELGGSELHVVHALAVDEAIPAQELYASLLSLIQAVGQAGEGRRTTVSVLVEGLRTVDERDVLHPDHAAALGPFLVGPQETAGLCTRILDVSALELDDARRRERVLAWLLDAGAPREVALRGTRFWERELGPVPAELATADLRLRNGGTYVITGGLGGVGLRIADWISIQVEGCCLALVSRSADELSPAQKQAVEVIRARGADVITLAADVTVPTSLEGAFTAVREHHGPITGVVHAAGVGSASMISRADVKGGLDRSAAKVFGVRALAEIVENDPLDFLLLCSSVTAEFGGPGQVDYAAANALLDAYAAELQRAGRPVVAVGWDTWQGTGMADRGAADGSRSVVGDVVADGMLLTASATFDSEGTWIVRDHRLNGHGLIPGTAYLELVRAVVAAKPGQSVRFQDIIFMAPVIVPAGRARTISVEVDKSVIPWRFSVSSSGPRGLRRDHAVGTVVVIDEHPPERVDFGASQPRGADVEVLTSQAEIGRRLGADRYRSGAGPVEFWFGPRWNLLQRVVTDGRHMLGEMILDPDFEQDLEDYPLHPALFDMAGGIFRMHTPAGYYLPFGYEEVTVYGALTPHLYCEVDVEEAQEDHHALSCSLRLLSPEGEVLVDARRFTIKKVHDLDGLHAMIAQAVEESSSQGETSGGIVGELRQEMSPTLALEGLRQLLSLPDLPPHVVVSPKQVERIRRHALDLTPADLAAQGEGLGSVSHPRPGLATAYAPPENDMERSLVEAWEAVLGIVGIGIDDDFFELGGHSLAAVHVNGRLKASHGIEMDLRTFFDAPTIRLTAAALAEQPAEAIAVEHDTAAEVEQMSDDDVDAMLAALL